MECQYCHQQMDEHHQIGPITAYICGGCQALAEQNAFTGQVTWTPGSITSSHGASRPSAGRFGTGPPPPSQP
jgi:hypothetical protein